MCLMVISMLAVIGYLQNTINSFEKGIKLYDVVKNALLTQWVYAHSEGISQDIARQIVNDVMETDKSLLLLAIFQPESRFNPSAMSPKGAVGLGQINWKVHIAALQKAEIINEWRDLFNIKTNIKATDFLLTDMLVRNKYDIEATLKAYLGGHDGIYVNRICKNYVELSLIFLKQNQKGETK